MTDQKQMESDQLLNYSTFTNSTFTNSIQVIVADDTEKPTTVLKQTDDTLKYRFAENLHFPLRHLWYLFEILIGIAVLLAFILPSLMIITLFSLLFRLLCCCCRNDDSNSLTIIYNDIHLWLISHKYSTCWNLPYFIFWHWLNYNVTFFLYVNYILLRTIGGIDGLYDSRKEMSDYYGDYQPFLGGLSCTNYSIVEQMMSDPNGGKGFVFQTLDVDIAKTFLKYSPVMLSTNTKEHLFSRGFFMAFLTPVFETIRDSNNSNNNNNSSTFNQEFDEIYAPRMAKLMESIRAEMIARGVKDGTSETDKELIEDVISSKQRQISRMAIHMLLFLFFWDEKQYTYVDLEKGDKTEGDIDRLIDNILDSWPALVLPTITYLPLAGIVIGQQKSLAEALRDLRNLFVENQNAPTMQSFIRYCDANDANVEEALYSLVSTIVIAAFLGLDESIAFGFKLFYQDFEKYNHEMFMQDKNRFIKEIIRYLGVRPGTNTLLLKQEQTLTIRGKNYKIPKNTPIMLLIGRANRDTTMFGDDVDSINPNRKGLDSNLLSWNGKEEYIISPDKEIQKKAPRFCPGHDVALFMISSVLEMGSRNKSVFDLDGPTRLNSTAKLIQEESFKDHVDVDKIHASLSFYNRTYGKIFVNNIKSVSAQREYDLLPKPINKYPERMRNEKGELKIREVKLFGVELHINDLYIENWGLIMTAIFDATKNFDTVLYPLKDDDELFYNKTKEPMKGKIKMKAIDRSRVMMKKYVRKKLHMPNVNVEWKEMKSNHAMSLFAFGGVVCHYTKVMDENDININSKAPKGSKYVHDVTWMYGYRVRKGLERYGGAAFFDDKCKLTGIYVSHLDKTFDARSDTSIDILYNDESKESVDSESDGKPDADVNANGNGADSDGNDLKYAKYVWLTSALASVTIKDHAFRSHLMESRALVQQLIQNLPLDHWLTRFLHIFTYRTVFINHNMYTLLLTGKSYVQFFFVFIFFFAKSEFARNFLLFFGI